MFAVLHIPDFQLEAVLRSRPELRGQPVAVIEERSQKARILQLTDAAREAGVCEGLTSPQAMARCENIHILPCYDAAERILQDILLQHVGTLSPWIEDTAPGTVTAQISSTLGIRTSTSHRTGVADTPDLALLAAHHADPVLVVEDSREFLAPLPVAALDPPPQIAVILKKWGIRTLGEFTALGKDALIRRLGPEAGAMFDRATGRHSRPLRLAPPPETYEETIEFEHEIETLQPLLFILQRFLDQLTARLNDVHLVIASLHLRLLASNDEILNHTFTIPEPTCDTGTLLRVLDTHLETLTTDVPVTALTLRAEPARPSRQQFGLFETALRDPNRFHETLARLAALVGQDRVGAPQNLDTHRPDAFTLAPFNPTTFQSAICDQQSAIPLRRFRPPIPAKMPPRGQAEGPFLSSGDWWDANPWAREEWDAQLPDGVYRMFKQKNEWLLDGIYD